MFEKEAKEYAHEHCCDSCKNLQARYRKVYQDGAEFGYNKANKWHEIASKRTHKGEISEKYMPKNKEKVLLKYHFSGDDEIHISDGYYDVYDSEFHIANNPEFRIVCVLAWREFLKKESEQNERQN